MVLSTPPIYIRTPVGLRGVNIREPSEIPARGNVVDGEARAKNKGSAPEQLEVTSSNDEGINYSTCLDNLSIPEDLFSGIYPFNLASSVESIAKACSYSFDWDSLDVGRFVSLSAFLYPNALYVYDCSQTNLVFILCLLLRDDFSPRLV